MSQEQTRLGIGGWVILLALGSLPSAVVLSCDGKHRERHKSDSAESPCVTYVRCIQGCREGASESSCVAGCRKNASEETLALSLELASCELTQCSHLANEQRRAMKPSTGDPEAIAEAGHAKWLQCSRERCSKERAKCGFEPESVGNEAVESGRTQ